MIDNQFGFKVGRSTANVVDCLIDSISNKLDNTYTFLTVSICLKEAFDTLDNGILLTNLSNFGIIGISLDLLHSYLTNRKQYVSYHKVDSNVYIECTYLRIRRMNIGVLPVLAPLLFLLYYTRVSSANRIYCIQLFSSITLVISLI